MRREGKIFLTWSLSTAFLSLLGVIAVSLLGKWIALLFLAEEYRGSVGLIPWLAAGFALLAVAHVFESALYAFKSTKSVLLGQSIAAAFTVAVSVPMIMYRGLLGAAIACPMYYSIYCLVMIVLWWRAKTAWTKTMALRNA
jgi:O-antigen/teichoic acid export membrane protein